MIFTEKIQKAIKFASKTHNHYQQQKRKGKEIPYIAHPLTVGIILSLAGGTEDVIVAGILHDTIEDSVDHKKVTPEMVAERFGENVSKLVLSVTEQDKSLSWEERKEQALNHVKHFSHESILVKSADVISNMTELIDDYSKDGETVFERFHASKEKTLNNQLLLIATIISCWPDSPLAQDMLNIEKQLQLINSTEYNAMGNKGEIVK